MVTEKELCKKLEKFADKESDGKKPVEKYIVFDIETTGLRPWFGDRVTCICAKDSGNNRFSAVLEDEYLLINSFLEWLTAKNETNEYELVTKNGKDFDIPFLLAWMSLQRRLMARDRVILECDHFDLHEIPDKKVSLKDMAILLGCKQKSGDGKNAIRLWEEKRFDELKDYCMNDVDVTEEVYLKHKELKGVKRE